MKLIDLDEFLRQNCVDRMDGKSCDECKYHVLAVSCERLMEQPTIDHAYGFPLKHLAFIARVMEKEGATPGEVAGLLRDAGRISEMVVDVMQKAYEKSIREAVRRIDDDPSHPFADGVMMKE